MKGIADEMIESGKIKPLIIVCPRIENSRGDSEGKFILYK